MEEESLELGPLPTPLPLGDFEANYNDSSKRVVFSLNLFILCLRFFSLQLFFAVFFWRESMVHYFLGIRIGVFLHWCFCGFLHDFLLALTGGLRRLVDSYR